MAVKKNLQKGGLRMRQVVATALALLLTLFLLPLLLLGEREAPEEIPTGTLPIDRTVVTPGVTADSWCAAEYAGVKGAWDTWVN